MIFIYLEYFVWQPSSTQLCYPKIDEKYLVNVSAEIIKFFTHLLLWDFFFPFKIVLSIGRKMGWRVDFSFDPNRTVKISMLPTCGRGPPTALGMPAKVTGLP